MNSLGQGRCHADVKNLSGDHPELLVQLDRLIAVVSQLQAEEPSDEVRAEAREVAAFFSGPARRHNRAEEHYVFPPLLTCDDEEVQGTAVRLAENHAWIELYWLDIEPQLTAAAAGDFSYDKRALYSAANVFATVMRDHVALMESLLNRQGARSSPRQSELPADGAGMEPGTDGL